MADITTIAEGRWFCSGSRHWNLEGPDPRSDAR
jgi:hypothetical protein